MPSLENSKPWMMIKQFEIWLADLNPNRGTEVGKVRPVVVIQTDLLNDLHSSTIVCPITSNVQRDMRLLRVFIGKRGLDQESDILVDQIRAIDNRRFVKKIGRLQQAHVIQLQENIKTILDL